jgi:hypothetical protein
LKERELTFVVLVEAGGGLEEALQESGVHLFHGQVLNAVHRPVHVVANALQKEKGMKHLCIKDNFEGEFALLYMKMLCSQNFQVKNDLFFI